MKILSSILLFSLSCTSWSAIKGINYDPAHSQSYIDAQRANNLNAMKAEISKDITIAKAKFEVIKIFYSMISTVDGRHEANIADLACPKGVQLMVGVYEFDPAKDNCGSWCDIARKKQVDNAIASVKKYNTTQKKCIIGIAVGNEDIYNWNFTQPNRLVQQHIAADIKTIKDAVGALVPVGTAQQDGALLQLANSDPNRIISKLDFIGANIYPYWSSPYGDISTAEGEFQARFNAIKSTFPGKKVVVTEEGWPSQYAAGQNPNASIANALNYYSWWHSRTDDFDSYYFGLFDKLPTNGDADRFFGLCTHDHQAKLITECN